MQPPLTLRIENKRRKREQMRSTKCKNPEPNFGRRSRPSRDKWVATARLAQEEGRELGRNRDAIPEVIVVLDSDGNSLYANQAILDYAGLTSEDLGVPDLWERIVHPDDVERLRGERKTALAAGLPFEVEQRYRPKDGQDRLVMGRYKPLPNEKGQGIRLDATGVGTELRLRAEERTRNEN